MTMARKYVLIPSQNIWNAGSPGPAMAFMSGVGRALESGGRLGGMSFGVGKRKSSMKVHDSLGSGDTALVALSEEERLRLHAEQPGLLISPVLELRPLWLRRRLTSPAVAMAESGGPVQKISISVKAIDGVTKLPIASALVQGIRNFEKAWGVENQTNQQGVAVLKFKGVVPELESISVEAASGYWPKYVEPFSITEPSMSVELELQPILFGANKSLGDLHAIGDLNAGAGVKVGVVDSGITPGADLVVEGGANLVVGRIRGFGSDILGSNGEDCGEVSSRPGSAERGHGDT